MRPHSLSAESHSFVGMAREIAAMPPALTLTTLSCYTHTHPAGAGTTLKGKRKKKADANDGQKARTARGEGNKRTSRTNLRSETDLTSTGHTPKPHNTLQRGTGEELGTEWGLVGNKSETAK